MKELTRRRFLTRTAAVVGAAGVAGAVRIAPAAANPGDDIIGFVFDEGGQVFNVKATAYGAKGDTKMATGGSISSGSAAFTAATATFASGDVGKVITVQGAGASGVVLSTTISGYTDSTHVTLATTAGTTVSGAAFAFGTDDTVAIVAAITAAGSQGRVFAPPGVYMIRGASNSSAPIAISGGTNAYQIGLLGAGGRCIPSASAAATVFLCGDASAGILANGWGIYQGFLVDGNNIATAPLVEGVLSGSVATNAGSYSTFIDVWSTASAGNGWSIYGAQNNSYYDCGTTNNVTDGLYIDGAAGGLDFWRFTESGSGRYGVHGDVSDTGSLGTYTDLTANVHFFGGELTSDSTTRTGVSKIYNRGGQDWKFLDMAIHGDNLSGPTVDLGQGSGTGSYGFDFTGCTISATPTSGGANPGRACIAISQGPFYNTLWTFAKTDGMRFLAGDTSVYIAATNGYFQYSAIGWIFDNTTNGPVAASGVNPIDTLLNGRTGKWVTATLSSPWTGTVKYRVRSDGLIELKGNATCSNGTGGTLFTLPTGYRPNSGSGATMNIPVDRSSGVNYVQVSSGGVVTSTSSGSGMVLYLDGVAFPTT